MFTAHAFEAAVCHEVRRSSKAQEGLQLPTFHRPHPPSGIPRATTRFLRVRLQRRDSHKEKRDARQHFLPGIHTKKVKEASPENDQVIDWCSELRRTYRVGDLKKTKALLRLNQVRRIPEEALGSQHIWIHLGEAIIDSCRHGDLKRLQAALLLGEERGITVNRSHNGHYPLGEVSTEKCARYLLEEGADLYLRDVEKEYTITNIHLSKLIFELQADESNPYRTRKNSTEERKKIITLLSQHINEKEKIRMHHYWKLTIGCYKKAYGELNYSHELPDDRAFLHLIKTLVPLKK